MASAACENWRETSVGGRGMDWAQSPFLHLTAVLRTPAVAKWHTQGRPSEISP